MDDHGLNERQVEELEETFRLFDKDGSGRIEAQELGTVMRSLGHKPTDDELRNMVAEHDKNENGTIEFDEFIMMMSRKVKDLDDQKELSELFQVFDRDNDGFIEAEDIQYVMTNLSKRLTDVQLREMIKEADLDNDGRINYAEFVKVMTVESKGSKHK